MKKILRKIFIWLFKEEVLRVSNSIQLKSRPFVIDTDDSDQLTFWKDIARWADNINAQRYAAKRIHAVLLDMLEVNKEDVHRFYILQGQLAELYKFSNLPKFTADKLEEVINELDGNQTDSAPQKSLVEGYGE